MNQRDSLEEISYDLSGPITPSLIGCVYAAHFIEPTTTELNISFLNHKSKTFQIVSKYITRVKNSFSSRSLKVRRIRLEISYIIFQETASHFSTWSPMCQKEMN